MQQLSREFFLQNTDELAKLLLGKLLVMVDEKSKFVRRRKNLCSTILA